MGNVALNLVPFYPDTDKMQLTRRQKKYLHRRSCNPRSPCGEIPCLVCGRAARRWFMKMVRQAFGNFDLKDLRAVFIVPVELFVDDEGLRNFDFAAARRLIREKIDKAGLGQGRQWLGAFDIAYNIERQTGFSAWSIHAVLITTSFSKAEKRKLRRLLKKNDHVPRPLVVKKVTDLDGLARYILKPDFNTRERYWNDAGKPVVRTFTLKGDRLNYLTKALTGVPHSARLITLGLKRHGNHLVAI